MNTASKENRKCKATGEAFHIFPVMHGNRKPVTEIHRLRRGCRSVNNADIFLILPPYSMNILEKLRGTSSLPAAESIREYKQLSRLVGLIHEQYEELLDNAIERHPELQRAWNVIRESAHPDCIIPMSPALDEGRRLMVADILCAIQTGELTEVQEEELVS